MANGRLDGHVAVVTGAGRGIGEAIARRYAEQGAAVVLAARTTTEIESVAGTITAGGGRALAVPCDVTSDDAVAQLAAQAGAAFGAVDIVVNNAGIGIGGPFQDQTLADFQRVMDVNLYGAVRVTQAFLPAMREAGWGRIVNVASTAGVFGSRFQSPYNASKHALVGLTRCLGWELADSGVTANAICPGFVDTPLLRDAKPALAQAAGVPVDQADQILLGRVAMNRFLRSDEIADLAIYLGSNESGGMTGEALVISAGLVHI